MRPSSRIGTQTKKAPPGQTLQLQGCETHDPAPRFVSDRKYEYFDFDCDYCTGPYSNSALGLFHHTWLAESPPPSPNTNLGVTYNYTDNPDRKFPAGGDGQVTIADRGFSVFLPVVVRSIRSLPAIGPLVTLPPWARMSSTRPRLKASGSQSAIVPP